MLAAHLALRIATEHSRDLGHAIVSCEDSDVGSRYAAARRFRDNDVVVRTRCDLRQMRYREHLMVVCHAPQGIANLKPDLTADSRINLVEYERRNSVSASKNCFEDEHYSRELSS